jgi:hypothetical protein
MGVGIELSDDRFRRYHAIPARIGQGLKSQPQATFGCGDFALIKNFEVNESRNYIITSISYILQNMRA